MLPFISLLFQMFFYSIAVLYLATSICLLCIYLSIQMEISREAARRELELVSGKTGRYYHFSGLDRILTKGNPENDWYYSFLEEDEECSVNIDNDEAAGNEITVFINCKVNGADGTAMGIVGVGFRVDSLQALLKEYEDKYGVKAYLVNRDGMIEISTEQTGYQSADLFESCNFPQLKSAILAERKDTQSFWYQSPGVDGYLVTRFVQNLDWFLIIDHNTSALVTQQKRQLLALVSVAVIVIAFVLITITAIIRKYNKQIVKLTVKWEKEHQSIFQKATEQFYENIYELDITNNRAASEATEEYFESLGVSRGIPYDKSLHIIAQKQIKEEYRQGYIEMFSPDHVLALYQEGVENLRYDFQITTDGVNYYWMRIMAHIFTWEEDRSVRMLTYRQNIDEEKQREQFLFEKMQLDSLTGLLNKVATQENIRSLLPESPTTMFAFYIVDVDNFKQVNDSLGHAAGDEVLTEFAHTMKAQFRDNDTLGRIGGDEFVAFLPVEDPEMAERRAQALSVSLCRTVETGAGSCYITASIGVAIAPRDGTDFETLYRNADTALYRTKKNGKNGYTLYTGETG